jgi:hypothetical protein
MPLIRSRVLIAVLCIAWATSSLAIKATQLEKAPVSSSLSLDQLDEELQVSRCPRCYDKRDPDL